jgi:FkbM family methyltransferase
MMMERALGVYEYWTFQLLRDLVLPDMTALDVGANKGDYSLLFAALMGDCGRVLAFEPLPDNLEWLHKSIDANGYKSIQVLDVALSTTSGEREFFVGRRSGGGSLVSGRRAGQSDGAITVRSTTLDDVLEEQKIEDIDVMKIDVEGAELGVLEGATALLQRSRRANVIVDYDAGLSSQRDALQKLLVAHGFQVFGIVGRSLIPAANMPESARAPLYATKEVPSGLKAWLPVS